MAEPTSETDIFNLEREAQQFLHYLGFAITEWAHIEAELFQVCEAILQTQRKLVAIIYYRTPTLDARLKLTDELILAIAPQPERKSGGHPHPTIKLWSNLRKDIEKSLPTRNQLAHSPAAPLAKFDQNDGAIIVDIGYASYMSNTEQLRGGKPKDALKLRDMQYHIASVSKLINRLRNFRIDELRKLLIK